MQWKKIVVIKGWILWVMMWCTAEGDKFIKTLSRQEQILAVDLNNIEVI
jgi:hypothetical protein